jgi:hypothetical protein
VCESRPHRAITQRFELHKLYFVHVRHSARLYIRMLIVITLHRFQLCCVQLQQMLALESGEGVLLGEQNLLLLQMYCVCSHNEPGMTAKLCVELPER